MTDLHQRVLHTQHAWNRIAVIQWLPPSGRKRTGDELHDFLVRLRRIANARYDLWFRDVSSPEELLKALDDLALSVEREGRLPILHLETHGSPIGIGSEDGASLLKWDELRDPLARLNRATRFNLLVVMAACHGARLFESLDPGMAAPCWAMVGPSGPVFEHRIESAFPSFYVEYLSSGEGQKAMRALAAEDDRESHPWMYFSANFGFRYFFAIFMADTLGLGKSMELNEEILRELATSSQRLNNLAGSRLEQMVMERSPRIRDRVESMQKAYYMTDTVPENESLFVLDLAKLSNIQAIERRLS